MFAIVYVLNLDVPKSDNFKLYKFIIIKSLKYFKVLYPYDLIFFVFNYSKLISFNLEYYIIHK